MSTFQAMSRPAYVTVLTVLLCTCLLVAPAVAKVIAGGPIHGDGASGRFGTVVAPAGDIDADGYGDMLVSAPWHDGAGTDFGRVYCYRGSANLATPSAPQEINGTQSGARFGAALCSAGDLNGDGYDEVAIGAPLYGTLMPQAGLVEIYRVLLGGVLTRVHSASGSGAFCRYGTSLSPAGDVNGDGFDDLLIGAPGENGGRGVVRLMTGNSGSIGLISWTWAPLVDGAQAGAVVAGAGDLNADGYADVAVADTLGHVSIFLGSASGLAAFPSLVLSGAASDRFGASIAGVGDLNGDGYADLLVGAPGYGNTYTRSGIVYAYYGGPAGIDSTPDWSEEGWADDWGHGSCVAPAGDLNGDGYADVVMGAPTATVNAYTHCGVASTYLGSEDGLIFEGASYFQQEEAGLGTSVAGVGDVNGDGCSDDASSAPGWDGEGALVDAGEIGFGYWGPDRPSYRADLSAWGEQADAGEGSSVALGDFDGDGHADVATGAPGHDLSGITDAGRVRVFRGGGAGPETTASWAAYGAVAQQRFGTTMAGDGDVNNDGYEDLLVGGRGDGAGRGMAALYLGSSAGLLPAPVWTTQGQGPTDDYGAALAYAGDVNGDGLADVLVGAPSHAVGGLVAAGKVYLYFGSPAGLYPAAAWTASGTSAGDALGAAVATAGDVNGDGYSDVIVGAPGEGDWGMIHVYYGSAAGLGTTPAWSRACPNEQDCGFGRAVASAGDFNDDGFSDIVVGAPDYDSGSRVDAGKIWLFRGSPTGPEWSPYYSYTGSEEGSPHLGARVGAADLNGDGRSDIVVGVPGFDDTELDQGQVRVYFAWPVAGGFALDWDKAGTGANARHGLAFATGRDVTGDGFPDLLTGMPGAGQTLHEEGMAALWAGNGHGHEWSEENNLGFGLHRRPILLQSNGTRPISLLGKSDSPHLVILGALARTPMGRGRVRLQCQLAPLGGSFGDMDSQSPILDTGPPVPGEGSRVQIQHAMSGLTPFSCYRWRVRVLSDSPYWKRSRWYTAPGNALTELDFRTGSNASGLSQADDADRSLRLSVVPAVVRHRATISFVLPRAERAELALHDVTGRRVARLLDAECAAGAHVVSWSGTGEGGARLASGVYFAVLRAGGGQHSAPIVIAK